jgi:signal transduction histidine kinase
LLARQRRLHWEVLGAGTLLLLGGFIVSHFMSGRLAVPVKKLVSDSEEYRAQRERAEAALEISHEELQRSARFSADASHQLKTPVTVLRAGLEEVLARGNFTPEQCNEISGLVHQTYRLANIIEDLLLLSRMDAGRLQIEFGPVDLIQLIDALLDDLSTMAGCPNVEIDSEHPTLLIAGEKRYVAIILQNLLENARKYNRPGGRILIACRIERNAAILTIGNTGKPIPLGARDHVFERFHRGAIGENVPGYGLGLNLARELAHIHGGDVRLTRSDPDWTELEVRFQLAEQQQSATLQGT